MGHLFPKPLRYPPPPAANFVKLGASEADLNEDGTHRHRVNIAAVSRNCCPQTQPVVAKSRVVAAFFQSEIEPSQ